jgi:hypothetical protein
MAAVDSAMMGSNDKVVMIKGRLRRSLHQQYIIYDARRPLLRCFPVKTGTLDGERLCITRRHLPNHWAIISLPVQCSNQIFFGRVANPNFWKSETFAWFSLGWHQILTRRSNGKTITKSLDLPVGRFYTPANEVRGYTVLHSSVGLCVRPINYRENRCFTEIWCEDTYGQYARTFFFIFAIRPIFWPPGGHLENQAGGRLSTICVCSVTL